MKFRHSLCGILPGARADNDGFGGLICKNRHSVNGLGEPVADDKNDYEFPMAR
jgi:hypothetical protein